MNLFSLLKRMPCRVLKKACLYDSSTAKKAPDFKRFIPALISGMLFTFSAALGQNITLQVKASPFADVLKEVGRQSGYHLLYKTEVLQNARPVTFSVVNEPLKQVLDRCMNGQPLVYELMEKNILIKLKNSEKKAAAAAATNHFLSVSGMVTNDQGQPMPGATLRPKGNNQIAAISDENGNFMISFPDLTHILVASFVGFETQEVTARPDSAVKITLRRATSTLGEVVINGYGTQIKTATTGAVGQLGASALENRDFTSVDQSLQGKVAGVQSVATTGQPGDMQEVRIRGIGSISASSEPLYVIDGIIINSGVLSYQITTSNALSGINPNDIESINVLKDASATAIYGSRAANGVIIITTKKGINGKTQINFDAEYGNTRPRGLSDAGTPLNTDQWRTLTAQGILNNPSYASARGITAANVGAYVDNTLGAGSGINTDWLKVIQRTGQQEQYNLSITGGNSNTQFHVSGGYFKQQGAVIGADFTRYSSVFDLKTKVNNRLSFSSTIIIGQSNQQQPFGDIVYSATHLLPFLSPYNADGSYNIDPSTFPASQYNPLYITANDQNRLMQLKGLGTISGEYRILDGLKLTSRLGIDYNNLEEDIYQNPVYGDGTAYGGLSNRTYTRYFNWTVTNMLDYHLDVHHDNQWVGNIKVGYEAQKSTLYSSINTSSGLPGNPDLTVPSDGATPLITQGTNENYTVASLLSLADVSYQGKYVLSGSFRRDGSSRFGAKNRYGNFWSIGGSWNVQEETFLKAYHWIDQLKLRGSYGLTGNANIGNYSWRQLYSYGQNYNNALGTGPLSVGNPDLTWETNKQLDLGIDVALLKNRIGFTFDYYNRESGGLLLDEPTSQTTGFENYINNVGSMRNRGVELSFTGTPLILGDFKWQAGFNIAHNQNKVLSLVNGQDIVTGSFIRRVGQDFQTFYLRQWAGVNPANGGPLWYTDASRSATTSNYNSAGLVAKYSATPKVFGGFNSDFSYHGFSLAGLLYYNFGNYIQDQAARYTQSDGANTSFNHFSSQLNAWQKPGDITNTPIYIFNNTNNSGRLSSRFLYKDDYIRLRELTVTYNFPKSVLSRLKIEGLKIYARGTNLATWVRDKNLPYDPEAGLTSQGTYNIPVPKIFSLGINVQF